MESKKKKNQFFPRNPLKNVFKNLKLSVYIFYYYTYNEINFKNIKFVYNKITLSSDEDHFI